jgi:hypothetical protein
MAPGVHVSQSGERPRQRKTDSAERDSHDPGDLAITQPFRPQVEATAVNLGKSFHNRD